MSPPMGKRLTLAFFDALTAAMAGALASTLWSSNPAIPALLWTWCAIEASSVPAMVAASRPWARTWARFTAWFQLGLLAFFVVGLASSAGFLWGMYGPVGTGLALVLLGIAALLFEVVGLLPIFKLRLLGMREPRGSGPALLPVCLLAAAGAWLWTAYPGWIPLDDGARHGLALRVTGRGEGEVPAFAESDRYVVRVFSEGAERRRFTANAASELPATDLRGDLREPTVLIDRIVARGPVLERGGPLSAFSLVAGLDGVELGGAMLLPDELVSRRLLAAKRVFAFVRDFRTGVDLAAVRASLCARKDRCPDQVMRRFRTETWLHDDDGTVLLVRGRPLRAVAVDAQGALAGARSAGDYVARHVSPEGRFTYLFDPVGGGPEGEGYSVPRHLGAATFLAALARETGDARYLDAAEPALLWIERRMRDCGSFRCFGGKEIRLGNQALALVAFAEHARSTGSERYAAEIEGLTRALIALQKPDGDFFFVWDEAKGRPRATRRRFYEGGEAAMALAMAAARSGSARDQAAARAAMDYLTGPYWDTFAANLFYIEEHWTCLTAREIWPVAPDERYARACRDIGSYTRHVQHGPSPVPEFAGGVGFSPLFVPHTTATAARTELLVAAYEMSVAQGEPDADLLAGVRAGIGFLLRAQFRPVDGWNQARPDLALGGIPWSFAEPTVRIDTIDHAGMAMMFAARVLGGREG